MKPVVARAGLEAQEFKMLDKVWLIRSDGLKTILNKGQKYGWSIQLYYPDFFIKADATDFYLRLDSVFRFVIYDKTKSWQLGIKLLGFGVGIAWLGNKCESCDGLRVIKDPSNDSNLNRVCKDCNGIGAKHYKETV